MSFNLACFGHESKDGWDWRMSRVSPSQPTGRTNFRLMTFRMKPPTQQVSILAFGTAGWAPRVKGTWIWTNCLTRQPASQHRWLPSYSARFHEWKESCFFHWNKFFQWMRLLCISIRLPELNDVFLFALQLLFKTRWQCMKSEVSWAC